MRDPKRIRPFLEKLAEKWEEYPDLRFGQLIENIGGCLCYRNSDRRINPDITCFYYFEEDEWQAAIDQYAQDG